MFMETVKCKFLLGYSVIYHNFNSERAHVTSSAISWSKCVFGFLNQTNTESSMKVKNTLHSFSSNKMIRVDTLPGGVITFNVQIQRRFTRFSGIGSWLKMIYHVQVFLNKLKCTALPSCNIERQLHSSNVWRVGGLLTYNDVQPGV